MTNAEYPTSLPPAPKPSKGAGFELNIPLTLGIILGVILLVIAIVVGVNIAKNNNIVDNGLTTIGTPTGQIIDKSHRSNGHTKHRYYIEYSYFVEGKVYKAQGGKSWNIKSQAERQMGLTDEVTVYYLPEDPTQVVIKDFKEIY